MKRKRTPDLVKRKAYLEVIKRERELQRLRYLIGTRQPIPNRHALIKSLKESIGDPKMVRTIVEATVPESFSGTGEKLVKSRMQRLSAYSALANSPFRKLLPTGLLRQLAFRSMDYATVRHLQDVKKIALAIFENLDAKQRRALGADRKTVERAAALHDEGKIILSGALLRKTAALKPEEMEWIRMHPLAAEIILKGGGKKTEARVARQHHMGGKGAYPEKRPGEKMARLSALVKVADVVEAASAGRFGRKPKGVPDLIGLLEKGRGKEFSKEYVDAMLKAFESDKKFLGWWEKRGKAKERRRRSDRRGKGPGLKNAHRRQVDDMQ